METMGPDLLAHIEGGQVWFADDEEPLLRAQHAGFGHWVKWCSSIQDPPRDGVGYIYMYFPSLLVDPKFKVPSRIRLG